MNNAQCKPSSPGQPATAEREDLRSWFEVPGDLDDFIFYDSDEKSRSER